MSDQPFHESVVKADRWSKVAALGVAIVTFLGATQLTADVQFSSIVAAVAGIGARLYIPYHASVRVPAAERTSLSDHPVAGNYHYGAAGLGLGVVAVVALVVFLWGHGFVTAIGVGVIVGIVGYLMLSSVLASS